MTDDAEPLYKDVQIPMTEMLRLRDADLHCEAFKVGRMREFRQVLPAFLAKVATKKDWTNPELMAEPFFEYICQGYIGSCSDIHSPAIVAKAIRRMRVTAALFWDIKQRGVLQPIDAWVPGGEPKRLVIERGNRRLEIMNYLGYKTVSCRIWKSHKLYRAHCDRPVAIIKGGASSMPNIVDRVDAVTGIPREYQTEIVPAPPAVKIELTSRCDLHCRFCATSQSARSKGDMDYQLLKKVLEGCWEAGVQEIGMFYLGESLLYPQLVPAIRYARELGFPYLFLTTNGRLLTEDKARDIIGAGLHSLKFSFNSTDSEEYQNTTGVDGFCRVVGNIRKARQIRDQIFAETGHWCGLYASSIWYDDQQPQRMRGALSTIEESIDQHYWLPLYNQAGLVPQPGATPGDMGRIGALRPAVPCWCLFREGHVTWDGVLTGCPFAHTTDWDFGDLKTISFMEAWNSEAAQRLRHAHLSGDVHGTTCERCIYQ